VQGRIAVGGENGQEGPDAVPVLGGVPEQAVAVDGVSVAASVPLAGVALVTSDAHRGLTDAIGATLPGTDAAGDDDAQPGHGAKQRGDQAYQVKLCHHLRGRHSRRVT
jgi:hypothetical protein